MSARASAVGSGFTAQSAKTNCLSLPGRHQKNLRWSDPALARDDVQARSDDLRRREVPGASTSCAHHHGVAASGQCTVSRACSSETGLPACGWPRRSRRSGQQGRLPWSTTTKPAA
jgi:hypothetical protein